MGTIFAPTYANLTMRYFEIKFYELCKINFGNEVNYFIYENWNRFLDDCQTLIQVNKLKPNELLHLLNSIQPSIQFTMEYSKTEVPF